MCIGQGEGINGRDGGEFSGTRRTINNEFHELLRRGIKKGDLLRGPFLIKVNERY